MRQRYPADLSDDQRAVIEPLIPRTEAREIQMREVLDAIF